MNKYILLPVVVLAISCGKPKEQAASNDSENAALDSVKMVLVKDPRSIGPAKSQDQFKIEEDIYSINTSKNPLYGYWVGSFGKNKINIALAKVDGDSIFGHSVCAGNFRSIKGTISDAGDNMYKIIMREPGDDKYDGEFKFTIDLSKNELSGTWKPYKNTVAPKEYALIKRPFKYDPTLGEHPEASTQYLKIPDVENLLPEEIEMIRNEIYARHGYSFTNLKIRRAFDSIDWYIPMAVDIRDQLTDFEVYNIDLLYNYEDYYEEYYNDYGR